MSAIIKIIADLLVNLVSSIFGFIGFLVVTAIITFVLMEKKLISEQQVRDIIDYIRKGKGKGGTRR